MSKHLPRRTFLRGLGTAMALPLLDGMVPSLTSLGGVAGGSGFGSVASAAGMTAAGHPKRLAFCYVPNGATMPAWTPTATGTDYELSPILEPLKAFKDDINVITGLDQNMGDAMGDGGGDHARASAVWLTGVHPKKTAGADIKVGISADQIAAQAIGDQTRLPSLELSCDVTQQTGSCDTGYSCAYQFNVSWRSDRMPMNPEVDPRSVFDRLFGNGNERESKEASSRRQFYKKSLLDFVMGDARSLQSKLGKTDQRKMDEYLTSVREIEKRLVHAEKFETSLPPGVKKPGMAEGFQEHVRLMADMMVLAFQTDSTRVSTLIFGHEGGNRAYSFIGVNEGHHDLSHHRNDPDKVSKITQINKMHMTQFAYFLDRLKSTKEGDGNLLDNSMVVYGSGLADGNRHIHTSLPTILAGRGGGTISSGRHIKLESNQPMNNLYRSLLDRMGAPTEGFGDSNGKLEVIA